MTKRAALSTAQMATLMAALFVAPAAFASDEAVGPTTTDDGAESVSVVVEVRRMGADFRPVAIGEGSVKLHIIAPPHEVVRTTSEPIGEDGVARFSVRAQAGLEAVAEVEIGRRFFGDPVDLSAAGEQRVEIDTYATTSDPGGVFAASMQTIVEPWENFLTFTQVWTFGVDQPVIYTSDRSDPSTLLAVTLPEGVEGVHVIRPRDDTRVVGNTVWLATEIAPAGVLAQQGPGLIVQFSLRTKNARRVAWDQALSMDVERLSVIVPQTSSFDRHPTLDVQIEVPRCGASAAGEACFDTVDTSAEGVSMRDDVPMLVARGRGVAGDRVRVVTVGWPARPTWERWAAVLAGLLALGVGTGLYAVERRRRRDPTALRRDALASEAEALLASGSELERERAEGLVLQHDYDVARERIQQQLGVIYRRLRELDAAREIEAPSGEASDDAVR